MHTIKILALGFVLLAASLFGGRAMGSPVTGAKVFLGLWFIGATVNMYLGVKKAGYSVAAEAPVFLVVYLVPASVAAWLWWRSTRG